MKTSALRIGKCIVFVLLMNLLMVMLLPHAAMAQGDNDALDREQRMIEATLRMRRGFECFESAIDISDLEIKPAELGRLFSNALKDTPYLFYVSNNLSYTYRTGGYVVAVKPKYTMERENAERAVAYCKEEAQRIADLVSVCDGELEKLIRVHDILCRDYSYDLSLSNTDIYSFLKEKSGTCQGYTWAYMAILREVGIECRYVASDTISHIWLAVKIDGEWYYSDVTWDDPPERDGQDEISRKHLLFSDEKADGDGYIDRYSSFDVKCNSKIYDESDLLSYIPFCALSGDIDHDGKTTLYDLLLLRLFLEAGNTLNRDICLVCADADGNHLINGEDAEFIRRVLLDK